MALSEVTEYPERPFKSDFGTLRLLERGCPKLIKMVKKLKQVQTVPRRLGNHSKITIKQSDSSPSRNSGFKYDEWSSNASPKYSLGNTTFPTFHRKKEMS